MSDTLSTAQSSAIKLGLRTGTPPKQLTLLERLHFWLVLVAPLTITLPLTLLQEYVLFRWRSPFVEVGRSPSGAIAGLLAQHFFGRASTAQARLIHSQKGPSSSYAKAFASPVFQGFGDWVKYEQVNGTAGYWLAPPGTKRAEDDVVVLYLHGGGFTLDTGANGQIFLMLLAKELNIERGMQFSVFAVDYKLAPEFRYPSQLIETLAAYHHLVNTLGVSETKICLAGDSAGGCLSAGFLLHLARPNPAIKVPSELGPIPGPPAAAILISPFTTLVSYAPSRSANVTYDIIDDGACFHAALDYIGATPSRSAVPTFNPLYLYSFPNPSPPRSLVPGKQAFVRGQEGEGLALFDSPYVNPSVCRDLAWWKEACPGEGRTMVTWGGKEIFADDDEALFNSLTEAGVAPVKLYKDLGTHNWAIFDASIPELCNTKAPGPESDPQFAVGAFADFLVKHFEGVGSAQAGGEEVERRGGLRRRG